MNNNRFSRKKVFILSITLLFFTLIQSCKMENRLPEDRAESANFSTNEKEAVDKARSFLQSGNVQSTNSEWADKVEFTAAYPLYIEGIDEVSYYECKATINGNNAGYVLINVNDTDVTVSEYSIDGITMTEQFMTNSASRSVGAKIFRYSAFEYLAINNTSRGQGDVVASFGFSGVPGITTEKAVKSEDITKTRNEFKDNLNKYGTAVGIDKDIITESNNDTGSRFHNEWTADELNHTFSGGWHLPHWNQTQFMKDGQNVYTGCVPLAYTMIYAYWAQFKGATNLFGGNDLNLLDTANLPDNGPGGVNEWNDYNNHITDSSDPIVHDAVLEIGEDVGTRYGTSSSSTTTGRRLETLVDNYGDDRGYSFSCDVDYGSEWLKGIHAYEAIKYSDMPLALSYKEGGGHHVAIEGVKYEERVRWVGRYNREMWYLCNWGHGNVRKWICTYNRGNASAEDRVTGVYHLSAYIPQPGEILLEEDFENGWNSWKVKHYQSSTYYNNSYRLSGKSEGFVMREGDSKALVIYVSDDGSKAEDIFIKRDFDQAPTRHRRYKIDFNARTESGFWRDIKVVVTNGNILDNGTIQNRSGLEVYEEEFKLRDYMDDYRFYFTPRSTGNFKVVFYIGDMSGYGQDVVIDDIKIRTR